MTTKRPEQTGEVLTPTLPENFTPEPLVCDVPVDLFTKSSSVDSIMAENKEILLDIADSVKSLRNGVLASTTVKNAIQLVQNKTTGFDGSNAADFTKWLAEMEGIHKTLGNDENQTLWAASQLLRGPALAYFQKIRNTCTDWATLKGNFLTRYANLNPADKAKRQLKGAVQQKGESPTDFAERISTLAQQAYSDRLQEKEVVETITYAFINGLRDRRLQESVARKQPENIEKAHDFAVNELLLRDHLTQFTDNSRQQPPPEPMDCSAVSQNDAIQTHLNHLDQVTKTLANISQVLTYRQNEQQEQQQRQQATGSQPTQFQQRPYQPPRQPQGNQQYQVQPQVSQQYQPHPSGPPPQRPPGMPQLFRQSPRQNPSFGRLPNPSQIYQWTPDHRPICHFCGNVGHIHRVCRKKAAAMSAQSQVLPPPPPPQRSGN